MEGCKVIDERKDGGYSTPLEAAGKDETFISRIREDKTKKNCLNMWVVSDNLLRGAAAPLNKLSDTTHIFKQFFFVLSSRILEIKVSSFPAASRGVEYPPSFLSSITLQPSIFSIENMEGCKVIDERKDGGYSTPLEAAGKDETFISRIREDKTKKNCLNMWVVSDNLLRGAALNAVEIAETLIKNNFYGK